MTMVAVGRHAHHEDPPCCPMPAGHQIRKPETRPGEAEARASGDASTEQPTAEGDG